MSGNVAEDHAVRPLQQSPVVDGPYDPAALASRRRLMTFVLVLSLVLMMTKLAAFWMTGSRALLGDALESVVNVITGAFGLFSVWLAGRPPDSSHPYGHGKIEFFSAGLEGTMILAASVLIVRESLPRIFAPQPITSMQAGALLAGSTGVVNGIVGVLLLRRGRRVHSATLAGEGHHLLTDTVTTIGVLTGLVLVHITGWLVLDPIAACAVAIAIAWAGIGLLRESASRLMDRSDTELLATITRVLEDAPLRPEWIEIHLMRAWRSGDFVHVDFHLSFPRSWTMTAVHASQREMLDLLIRRMGRPGDVMIHPDPCRPELCPSCRVEACADRGAPFTGRTPWTLEQLTGGPAEGGIDACQTIQAAASRETSRLAGG